jgi:hypothetical protein
MLHEQPALVNISIPLFKTVRQTNFAPIHPLYLQRFQSPLFIFPVGMDADQLFFLYGFYHIFDVSDFFVVGVVLLEKKKNIFVFVSTFFFFLFCFGFGVKIRQ